MVEKVEDHMGLVNFIAQKYMNVVGSRIEFDDLMQEGAIGLLKATRAFDPEKNVKFSTFASICIHNQIKMYIRRQFKFKVEYCNLDAPIVNQNSNSDIERITLLDTRKSHDPTPEDEILTNDIIERIIEEAEKSNKSTDRRTKQYIFYFSNGWNQDAIAEELGLSQSYVSRERTALKKKFLKYFKENR